MNASFKHISNASASSHPDCRILVGTVLGSEPEPRVVGPGRPVDLYGRLQFTAHLLRHRAHKLRPVVAEIN